MKTIFNLSIEEINDLIIISKKKKIVLSICPQIQLAPYLATTLNEFFDANTQFLIFGNPKETQLISNFPKLPNQRLLEISEYLRTIDKQNEFAEILFSFLLPFNKKNLTFIFHNFAAKCHGIFAEKILKSFPLYSESNFIFYSDGSRNNESSEAYQEVSGDLYESFKIEKFPNLKFVSFGFKHHIGKERDIDEIIDYSKIEIQFKKSSLASNLIIDSFNLEKLENKKLLVISRYLGREPYLFDESLISVPSLFSKSIEEIADITKSKSIVIKFDNRFNLNKKVITKELEKKYTCFDFDYFCKNIPSFKYLMENIIILNPHLLKSFKSIFCYDSSFPLIFQSNLLYSLLPPDISIYCGFPENLLKKYGSKNCKKLMHLRTYETLISITKLNLFNIYSGKSLIYGKGDNKIFNEIDFKNYLIEGNGLFKLNP